jgi:predicted ArsR family transcriptional regulator
MDHTPDDPGRGLGRTRSRVLALAQDVGEPVSADDVAQRMALHPNTARFHLEALEAAGLLVRTAEARKRPGRPRTLFAVAPGVVDSAPRSYRLLAEILSSFVSDRMPEPRRSAEEVGEAWGRHLADRPEPSDGTDAQTALDALVGRLQMIGFDSHAVGDGDQTRLEISHCPFLEVATGHREVVCSMHLGLMRGLLDEMAAPLTAESLEPLVEPSRCIAHLKAV